jgi:branched-subunit amino acid aminotransferase/4-amino-4-deoxychorismate lyase
LTGTAAEIGPLVEVNHQRIGEGEQRPMTMRLIEAFKKVKKTGTPAFEK